MPNSDPDEVETVTKYAGGLQWWVPLRLNVERTITKRWLGRADAFGEQVGAVAGMSSHEIARRVTDNEVVGDLLASSVDRAARTSDRDYSDGLARLVGAGLRDDARVDEVAYLLSILTQLEPVHLRVLKAVSTLSDRRIAELGPTSKEDQIVDMVDVESVASVLDLQPFIALSCAQRLVGLSLLSDMWEGSPIVPTKSDGSIDLEASAELFHPTQMGRLLLSHCEKVLGD